MCEREELKSITAWLIQAITKHVATGLPWELLYADDQGPIQGVTAGTQYRGPPTLGAPQVEFFKTRKSLLPIPMVIYICW